LIILSNSLTWDPATIAFVVANAGTMLPAILATCNLV
jgi:hypothetical protein